MQLYKLHNTNISTDWTSHPDQSRFLNQFQLNQSRLDQSCWPDFWTRYFGPVPIEPVPILSVPIGLVLLDQFYWPVPIGPVRIIPVLLNQFRTCPIYKFKLDYFLFDQFHLTSPNLAPVWNWDRFFKIPDPHLPNFSTFNLKYPHFTQLNVYF